jgi:hypothetical protein
MRIWTVNGADALIDGRMGVTHGDQGEGQTNRDRVIGWKISDQWVG